MSAHNFNRTVCGWRYCCKCGLIALNNLVTRRAIQRACPVKEKV